MTGLAGQRRGKLSPALPSSPASCRAGGYTKSVGLESSGAVQKKPHLDQFGFSWLEALGGSRDEGRLDVSRRAVVAFCVTKRFPVQNVRFVPFFLLSSAVLSFPL